jgi:DNA polymerase alpha subunit A
MRYFTSGRIICDTSLSLQEIMRESNYEITFLANRYDVRNNLKGNDEIYASQCNFDVEQAYQALEEARVCFELLNKFNILQLNKQLCDISGSLWVKSLQNSRTDRSEHLLLHELKRNKFILPDKSFQTFSQNIDETNEIQENKKNLKIKNYEGGLVLEPKTGFYDQIVLVLDFNSLYPSIIQQYNICFTTVERKPSQHLSENRRKADNQSSDYYDSLEEENIDVNIIRKTESKAILPQIIESLVLQRNSVKETMKKEKDLFKKEMLNIKQLALKLSANSLYGNLGYQSSRFYSKIIAALITKIGREILRETVRIVKQIPNNIENCALDIIYGDTDSIMVNTLTNDLKQALEIGEIIKGIINDKERIIKIEIDYVFKNMLLLKKKKYAGLKYENAFELRNTNFVGEPVLKKEFKGLDMVRRDWCTLSKEIGIYIMDLLLSSEKPKEEVINLIYDYLRRISLKMNNGSIPKEQYVISKQLVKNIDQYSDVNLLPHLKVARRLREKGDLTINSGTIINYIICNINDKSCKKISDKAFHINELIWYKENQLLMSVNRLLKHIKEVQMEMLVECLELNKSKYVIKEATNLDLNGNEKDIIHNIYSVTLMYARNGISLQCEYCGNITRIIKIDESNDNIREMLYCNFCKSEQRNMVKLMNIFSLHCKKLISKYYYGHKSCSKCQDSTRVFLKEK